MSGIVGGNAGRSSGSVEAAGVAADSITGDEIADDAIDSEHYTDGSIDEDHIANNAVTLAKMAGGTDGHIISFDASGNPVAIATGSDGQILTSTGAGSPPAFETAAGGGKVLQCVTTAISANSTFTGTPHTAAFSAMYTLISRTITPSVASSKILCFYSIGLGGDFGQTLHIGFGTTEFAQGDAASNRSRGIYSGHSRVYALYECSPIAGTILHDPGSTTSLLTYHIKVTNNGSVASYFNRSASHRDNALGYDGVVSSHLTLMEIGA